MANLVQRGEITYSAVLCDDVYLNRISEKKKQKVMEREEACAEQKKIEKEVVSVYIWMHWVLHQVTLLHVYVQAEFMEQQAKQKAEQEARQVALQAQLDKVVEDKVAQQQRMTEQDMAENRSIELFQEAKKVHVCGVWSVYGVGS